MKSLFSNFINCMVQNECELKSRQARVNLWALNVPLIHHNVSFWVSRTKLCWYGWKKSSFLCLVQRPDEDPDRKPLCLGENSVMWGGGVFKPRDPGGASNNPVICPERLGGDGTSGRGVGLYRRTQRTLMLCYCEGRRHTLEMSFCCSFGFKDSWRRGLACQSGMRDIIGIPVVPNAHVVNQLDGPPPSAHCRLNACELALRLEQCYLSLWA